MVSLAPLFCVIMCVLGLGARAEDLDISVSFGDNELDINIDEIPNPCDEHECSPGEKCEPVFTPSLIGFPVAHCVSIEEQKGTCVHYTLSSPISCKTKEEWESIGNTQCILRGTDQTELTDTEVKYACRSFHRPKELKFMNADLTCCKKGHTTTPKPSEKPSEQLKPEAPPAKDSNEGSSLHNSAHETSKTTESSIDFSTKIIPVVLALLVLLAVGLILLVVWQRNHSARRRAHTPKMVFATSFVNPNAEHQSTEQEWVVNPLDTTDKSLLIVNEASSK